MRSRPKTPCPNELYGIFPRGGSVERSTHLIGVSVGGSTRLTKCCVVTVDRGWFQGDRVALVKLRAAFVISLHVYHNINNEHKSQGKIVCRHIYRVHHLLLRSRVGIRRAVDIPVLLKYSLSADSTRLVSAVTTKHILSCVVLCCPALDTCHQASVARGGTHTLNERSVGKTSVP